MGLTGPVIIAQAWSGAACPIGHNAHADTAHALKLIRQSTLELIIRVLPLIDREQEKIFQNKVTYFFMVHPPMSTKF